MTTPEMPSREQLAKERHALASNLLIASEQIAPLFDAADGIRADLQARGWSPTAAEQIATTWVCTALTAANSGGQK
ncbi:hypothetical protein AB0451_03385 [Streptomyces sp. NPDC052000]|uniref:hypothetical protein n=1 Tax=Streptomyces sp. NPDC052000 TaxID=3155676 RepID=UPI003450304C